MKKKILFCAILLTSVFSMAQTDISVSSRIDYMIKTYEIGKETAAVYETIRSRLLSDNNLLKQQKLSSKDFKSAQKLLYKRYADEINRTFYQGKNNKWGFCNQYLERYHMLSENWLVPYETMRSLQKLESEFQKRKNELHASVQTNPTRYKEIEINLNSLNQSVIDLLGKNAGEWYIEYKLLYQNSLKNMDIYKASYHEANIIALIERDYRKKRRNVLKERKPNIEKEFDFAKLDEEKIANITSSVSSEVSSSWKKINTSILDYNLVSKFGLPKTRLEKFKISYSKYVIEEYKILNAKKINDKAKYVQLKTLSDDFCKSVSVLFPSDKFKKWKGWWEYSFERKMNMKGLK